MSDHDRQCEFMLSPPDANRLGLCRCKERFLSAEVATLKARLAEAERLMWGLTLPHGSCGTGACTHCDAERDLASFVAASQPSAAPFETTGVKFYRMQRRGDPGNFADFDPHLWALIVVPADNGSAR